MWDVDYDDEEYMCASMLNSHLQDVKRVAWHHEKNILACASYDNTVRIHKENSDDWVCMATLSSHTSSAWDRREEAEGDRIACCSEDTRNRRTGRVSHWLGVMCVHT